MAPYAQPIGYPEMARAFGQLGMDLSPQVRNATMAFCSGLHPKLRGVAVARNVAYGPDVRQVCNIFTPDWSAEAPACIVVFIHGGGFVKGDKELEGTPFYDNVGYWAARHRFIGVTASYRLAPAFTWPAGGDDVAALLKWLWLAGGGYGAAGLPLFLIGHSAGATHVATCVTRVDDATRSRITGAILNSGIYDVASAARSDVRHSLGGYFGDDDTAFSRMSTLAELARLNMPLMFTVNEREPAAFQLQGLDVVNEIFRVRSKLPSFVTLAGHNHYSSILNVGHVNGDILGEHMRCFIAAVSARTDPMHIAGSV